MGVPKEYGWSSEELTAAEQHFNAVANSITHPNQRKRTLNVAKAAGILKSGTLDDVMKGCSCSESIAYSYRSRVEGYIKKEIRK